MRPVALALSVLAVAALNPAAAQDAPLRTEWQDVEGPKVLGFAPGAAHLLLALDEIGRPRLLDFSDAKNPVLVLSLPLATAASFVGPSRIATGHQDGSIRLWAFDGRAQGVPLAPGGKKIEALTLSPKGRLIGTLDEKHALTVWSADFARRLGPFAGSDKCEDGESEPRRPVIAFAPDESLIAATTECGGVLAWTAAGRPVAVPKRQEPVGTAYSLAFSPDGRVLAAQSKGQPGDFAHLWPVAGGKLGPARKFPPATFHAHMSDLAPLPGAGADAFVAAIGGHIRFLAADGRARGTIPFRYARQIAVSADGKRLAASNDRRIAIWDEKRQPVTLAPFHDFGAPFGAALSPDDTIVAAVDDEFLRFWRTDGAPAGPPIAIGRTRHYGTSDRPRVTFAADGRSVVVVDSAGFVRTIGIDGKALGPVWRAPGYTDETGRDRTPPLYAGGRILAVDRSGKNVQAYDVRGQPQGKPVLTLPTTYRALAVSADGRHFAFADYRSVHIFTAGGSGPTIVLSLERRPAAEMLAFSPDGALLATSNESGSGTLFRLAAPGGAPSALSGFVRFTAAGEILTADDGRAVLRRPDGSAVRTTWIGIGAKVLAASADGTRALVEAEEGARWLALDGTEPAAASAAIRRAGLRIATVGAGGEIFAHFSDGTFTALTADGALTRRHLSFTERYTSPTGLIAPDGRHMTFLDRENSLAIATEAGARPAPLRGRAFGFAPDGAILALNEPVQSAQERGARVRLLRHGRDGAVLAEVALPRGAGRAVAVAATDGAIAVAVDKTIVLLTAAGDETAAKFAPLAAFPRVLAFSPDGTWLAGVDVESRFQRWRRDGSVIATPPMGAEISRIRFAPDGRHLLATTGDGKLRVWRIEGEALLPVGAIDTVRYLHEDGFGVSGNAIWHLDAGNVLALHDLALRPLLRLRLAADGYAAELLDGRHCGTGPIFETRRLYRGTAPVAGAERNALTDCGAVRAALAQLK